MLLRSLFRRVVVVGGELPWLRICEICKITAPCRASHRARDCACMSQALVRVQGQLQQQIWKEHKENRRGERVASMAKPTICDSDLVL